MARWKVITSAEQIKYPGIYQEIKVVMVDMPAEYIDILKAEVIKRNGDLAEVPAHIQASADRLGVGVLAFWANKYEPHTRIEDIEKGNIRIQISEDE